MQLRFILFADAANLSTNAKLNLVGEFTAVSSAQLPATLARASVVYRLELSLEEAQHPHVIGLEITHPEIPGAVFRAESHIPPAALQAPIVAPVTLLATQVYDVVGLVLPRFGRYTVAITADGTPAGEAVLSLLGFDASGTLTAGAPNVPVPPGVE